MHRQLNNAIESMVDASDAENLVVPYGLFPSKDEPMTECEKIVDIISNKPFAAKSVYKAYQTVHHGWAAARANLNDAENKKQYEDVYGTLAAFFKNIW
ncbi:hypothetical protein Clacol_008173 [Clathrus columnatus]|uniref:Uncharacterized protein n=1 Tax=Clathrus columnatus TaxID=1419009 RepID=A0AAV5ALW7_9AGAM|nr:hypothetical protein Clacol_008173 [Clathrus columnatus]